MIEVEYAGRLGNNLFQYCLGRILAEELGYALEAPPIPDFPRTAEAVDGERHAGPVQVLTGQTVPLEQILADRTPRRIKLSGFFQDAALYRPYRERILKWLSFDTTDSMVTPRPALVMHVRRTDYLICGWAVPFSFYEEALERAAPQGEVWITTDDPKDVFFRHFKRWRPRIVTGSPIEDIRLMASARTLVMSASTFAWWAAFLAFEEQEVFCPRPAFGIWSPDEPDRPDLIEDHFRSIDVPKPYRPSILERNYQSWRLLTRPFPHEAAYGHSTLSGALKFAWPFTR